MRTTPTIPAIPPLAMVKTHPAGTRMSHRVSTVMMGSTTKMEVKKLQSTMKRMVRSMNRRKGSTPMRRKRKELCMKRMKSFIHWMVHSVKSRSHPTPLPQPALPQHWLLRLPPAVHPWRNRLPCTSNNPHNLNLRSSPWSLNKIHHPHNSHMMSLPRYLVPQPHHGSQSWSQRRSQCLQAS